MLAFRKAIEEGARGIEMDVRKTQDGTFIIMHDDTVDRTTDGTGDVRDLDWAYLSSLDAGSWKGTEFASRADTKIPRLDEVILEFKGKPIILFLHMRLYSIDAYLELANLMKSEEMLGQVVFFGYMGSIATLKQVDEKCFIMNDGFAVHSDFENTLQQAISEGWNAMSIYNLAITKEMVEEIKSNGILTNVSYLSGDYVNETERMIDIGVDFILTNDPIAMMPTLNNNYVNQITTLYSSDAYVPDEKYDVKIRSKGKWIDSMMQIKKY